ncbi:acyltransferase [Vibrio neptunius]|uniref:Acyltransferase n=1 Tax=Vibrio neptunius TaxID=170651 RepID=A0ABS3A5B7_9VIBR|nr:acyltransferase [Vibrio neptunius]MBN3494369.1 acyltransferase [Vibrio neptunius]MBN3516818.1 acyltransferase [Vibrio neptunius]MBN3551086.1 acyltransferase [Vibrio neptunius]MBN3579215.1 acyltransferase [Vibrio neptunius]MCH9872879.1 acyltransferase [Vibrio neptunius]
MFAYLLLVLNVTLVILNSAFCSVAICIIALIKVVLPTSKLQAKCTAMANWMMWLWATINSAILSLFNRVEWDIEGGESLTKDGWYLLISNHLSWTDIVVLCCVFKDRIPMPKFFLKQQLFYVPFIGMACWALDMPFMRRYSREYLLRHPEKRGQDLETTRRSCAKFRHTPTTVVNYVEGTRFTQQKQKKSKAGYQHLLQPKTGGMAYTLAAMGDQFENIIDVTLAYPENTDKPFRDILMGRMTKIVVRTKVMPVDENVRGDYFNDKPFKRQFQQWLGGVWKDKDELLKEIHQDNK